MGSISRRLVLAGAGGLVAAPAIVRAQGRNGVALVIGNSKYQWEAQLANVKRDAPDVAKCFQAMGLKTELVQDLTREAAAQVVEKFKAAASGAELAVFYYAGHGASWGDDTYLVPVDADLSTPDQVKTLVSVRAISTAMKGAAHRLLVFDNCRNSPADGWRQRAASEQAKVSAAELTAASANGPNTLLLFSTAPGRTALDGPPGANSPFVASFLRQFKGPSVDITQLPASLRRDLLIATEGQQVVWDESTYTAPFALDASRVPATKGGEAIVAPSRIVELPKTYAFASEKKLPLPKGLVAIRPDAASPHARKIGAYEFTTKVNVGGGGSTASYAWSIEPFVIVVLSIPDANSAEAILTGRDFAQAGGAIWRFIKVRLSGEEMEWALPGQSVPGSLRWSDANSGRHSVRSMGSGNGMTPFSSRFTRLDG